jgi:hypothetical protein
MDSTIRKMTIQTLKMQVDVCPLQRECLSSDFAAAPTFVEREILAHRWDKVLKEKDAFQFMLDLLER